MEGRTKRKLIDLSEGCIKTISKLAIDQETDFKNYVQNFLEKHAIDVRTKKKVKT